MPDALVRDVGGLHHSFQSQQRQLGLDVVGYLFGLERALLQEVGFRGLGALLGLGLLLLDLLFRHLALAARQDGVEIEARLAFRIQSLVLGDGVGIAGGVTLDLRRLRHLGHERAVATLDQDRHTD